MAAQIHRELEETRADLRRGILDLPQETQETTGEMRRVVAEQIKALNELAALVSRSSRAVDAAAPIAAPATRRGGDGGGAARFTAPEPTPPAAPARAAEPPPARRETGTSRRDDSGQQGREGGGGQGRWLSELLTRGSRDEQPSEPAPAMPAMPPTPASPPPRQSERTRSNSLESLDSISADIARMIDHDTAVELWDRYRRGERNVFTRRLYTVQGQQTFDEIRRKYRREADFKQTVDRYVDEFERLLAEVTRDDRDPTLARTYLTSETGKVYTMLAHASGRFD
jgi:hypothetical protein